MKQYYNVSFSGGRTSAYMTYMLLKYFADKYEFIVTFANTGREHPATLDFIHACDVNFGFNTVWLEAVVHHDKRRGCTHKVVDYASACRDGAVFEEVIKKYGLPNVSFPHCTRELKLNPIHSYLNSLGLNHTKLPTAVGIRADEKRRVSSTAEALRIDYPLIDVWPTDKQDVLDWWADQAFDLGIEEFEGNCRACFKKSDKKQFQQIVKDRSVFDWNARMERQYGSVGPQDGHRVFFRGNRNTATLLATFDAVGGFAGPDADKYANSGCSESCEFLPTEGGVL